AATSSSRVMDHSFRLGQSRPHPVHGVHKVALEDEQLRRIDLDDLTAERIHFRSSKLKRIAAATFNSVSTRLGTNAASRRGS
ncbi:MAG: hypothetical protein ACRDKZ_02555, partial [Actinomycetota bacterium]